MSDNIKELMKALKKQDQPFDRERFEARKARLAAQREERIQQELEERDLRRELGLDYHESLPGRETARVEAVDAVTGETRSQAGKRRPNRIRARFVTPKDLKL